MRLIDYVPKTSKLWQGVVQCFWKDGTNSVMRVERSSMAALLTDATIHLFDRTNDAEKKVTQIQILIVPPTEDQHE